MQSGNEVTHTRDRIKEFYRLKLSVKAMPTPMVVSALENVSRQISGIPVTPTDFDIESTYQKILNAYKSDALNIVDVRDWKVFPYLFWYGEEKLADKSNVLNFYLNELSKSSLASNWRRVIFVYLRHLNHRKFHPEAFSIISAAISWAINHSKVKHRLENWKNINDLFGIFSITFDPKLLKRYFCIDAKNGWNAFSNATGINGELSHSGISEIISDSILEELTSNPSQQIIESAKYFHLSGDNMRFGDRRVKLIEALLSPWINGVNNVGEEARKSVQDWLLARFHDPRLPVHARGEWRGVSEGSIKVMLRWLVGESLNQFFEIIDQIALEGHWKYRKAFWKAYYDRGYLDEAWVALGQEAKDYALRIFGNRLSAGELQNVTDRRHSVLIVRIDDLILADWSHNGKCRAWKIGAPHCPDNYKLSYSGRLLKAPSMRIVDTHLEDGISHQGSENYLWQSRLANFIYEQTGIRIQQRDFRI
jgi:hypothetical protein